LNFGSYDQAIADPLENVNTVTVTCSIGTGYTIGLVLGASATTELRIMTDGTNTLNYALYRDSSRTQLWGNTVGTDTEPGTATTSTVPLGTNIHTVYGRISSGQNVPAGIYTDIVTVTVAY
jgi:spore coat protein U-like protein